MPRPQELDDFRESEGRRGRCAALLACNFREDLWVNVQDYLEDALSRVSTVKAKDIAVLTPWGWGEEQEKAAANPAG